MIGCVAPAPVTVDFTQFLEPAVHVVQVVQVPHLQIIKTVETLVSLFSSRHPNLHEFGTCPVRRMKPVEMVEVGPPLSADSAPPMFVTTPMVAAPLVVVEDVQPGPMVEHAVPAPAKTRTSFSWTLGHVCLIWSAVHAAFTPSRLVPEIELVSLDQRVLSIFATWVLGLFFCPAIFILSMSSNRKSLC